MKKPKTPTPVITAILTLITIFFWAGFEVYRSFTVKLPPQVPEEIIRSLDPTLDIKNLDELVNRPFLPDSEITNNVIASPSPTPSIAPSPLPTASPESTILPSPTP